MPFSANSDLRKSQPAGVELSSEPALKPIPQLEVVKPVHRAFRLKGADLTQTLVFNGVRAQSTVKLDPATEALDPLGHWWQAYLRGVHPQADQARGSVRFAELFCASGGMALGFSRACRDVGLQPRSVAAVDQDAEALNVYRRHNQTRVTSTKSVASLIDFRVRGQADACRFIYEPEVVEPSWVGLAGNVDVLLAGPPCQGHSSLNNKSRGNDKRNELYLTVPAMAVALQAPVVIIENVRAVIHDRRQVVQSAAALLREAGYHLAAGVLKAQDLGWPQRRERYFLIARRDTPPIAVDDVADGLRAEEPFDVWWAIEDLEDRVGDGFMTQQPEFSPENRRRIDWLFEKGKHDLPNTERPDCHKDGTTYNAVYGRLHRDRPAPTITTGFMTPGRGRYIHPTQPRVLTPLEAARLQGFPDGYDFRPTVDTEPSKYKLAKWIGDAVPMPLGYAAALSALGPGWPPEG